MKKSIVAIGIGAFAVVTSLLCMNPDGRMYQKQKHFNSVNDVLKQLENNKINEIDKNWRNHETSDFKECLSKRKRLTFSQMNFEKIEIEKVEELDEENKNSLVEDYNKAQERLAMPYKPTRIEPVRLDIKATYPKYTKEDESVPIDRVIDLVMVDEGEGMVIDYYVERNNEDNKVKEEGKINAED